MRTLHALLLALFLAFVATMATPNAAAQNPPPGGCAGTGIGDHDGDGLPEASGSCQSPPCLCNCPAVGEGVELVALGQDVQETAIVGCGYYVAYNADPGDVDWDGPLSLSVHADCWGGALRCDLPVVTVP